MLLTAWSSHVWTSTTFLPVGLFGADRGAGALCAAQAGELLAVRNSLRRVRGRHRVHRSGSATRRGPSSRRVPGIRASIAHPGFGIANYRQSFGWELRGTGRALPGTETVCEGARRV